MTTVDNIETPAPSIIFSTLASARRRTVLRELVYHGPSLTVATLAERVASEHSDADLQRAVAQLHHNHLPKLEDSGIVTNENETVTLTESGGAIEPYLLLAERYESRHKR